MRIAIALARSLGDLVPDLLHSKWAISDPNQLSTVGPSALFTITQLEVI